jgi:hypothetical protein
VSETIATTPFDLGAIVGVRFPDGRYTITSEENERFRTIVNSPPLAEGTAHPMFGHIATHVGKGTTFAEFAALVGSRFDAGFLFGGGSLEYYEPIRVDREYVVRGGILSAERREGRRSGRFDVVTTELDLVDAETGARVCRSVESYIVPREEQ